MHQQARKVRLVPPIVTQNPLTEKSDVGQVLERFARVRFLRVVLGVGYGRGRLVRLGPELRELVDDRLLEQRDLVVHTADNIELTAHT